MSSEKNIETLVKDHIQNTKGISFKENREQILAIPLYKNSSNSEYENKQPKTYSIVKVKSLDGSKTNYTIEPYNPVIQPLNPFEMPRYNSYNPFGPLRPEINPRKPIYNPFEKILPPVYNPFEKIFPGYNKSIYDPQIPQIGEPTNTLIWCGYRR